MCVCVWFLRGAWFGFSHLLNQFFIYNDSENNYGLWSVECWFVSSFFCAVNQQIN